MSEKVKNKSLGNYNILDSDNLKKSIFTIIESNINYNTYLTPKGLKELRQKIIEVMTKYWCFHPNPEETIITSCSQQSINLVFDSILKNNDTILIEQPTYYGTLDILKNKSFNKIGINLSKEGFNLKELEEKIIKYNPKLIYVVPTFHNPTGYSWSKKSRVGFLKLINKYNILVIEDDPYHLINFTNKKYPTLYELNKGKNIIYLGTFSKYISPSINVGYIFANNSIINKLYQYKKSYDLCTSAFNQYVILDYLNNYNLEETISKRIPKYQECLSKSLINLKEQYRKEIISITEPKGGLFYLIKFKSKIDESIFDNGNNYYLDNNHENETRINICSYFDE